MEKPKKEVVEENILLNPFLLLFVSGVLLNISYIFHNIYAQLLALILVIPLFYAINKLKKWKLIIGGIVFLAPWIFPTYLYTFFANYSWAMEDAIFFFIMMLLPFIILGIIDFFYKRHIIIDFAILTAWWAYLAAQLTLFGSGGAVHFPDLAYTQWLNPLILQIDVFAGQAGIVFAVLLIGLIGSYLLLKEKYKVTAFFIIGIIAICLICNFAFQSTIGKGKQEITIIAVQAPSLTWDEVEALLDQRIPIIEEENEAERNAYKQELENKAIEYDNDAVNDEFDKKRNEEIRQAEIEIFFEGTFPVWKELTLTALEKVDRDKLILVVWPESFLQHDYALPFFQEFAKEQGIYLAGHSMIPNEDKHPFNTGSILNPDGKIILTNYKAHDEEITPNEEFSSVNVRGMNLVVAICADLNYEEINKGYADLNERIKGTDTDLLIGMIHDASEGPDYYDRQIYFHAANTIFRAVENRVDVVTAGTTGPTFFANKWGIVEKGLLPLRAKDTIIINTKI